MARKLGSVEYVELVGGRHDGAWRLVRETQQALVEKNGDVYERANDPSGRGIYFRYLGRMEEA